MYQWMYVISVSKRDRNICICFLFVYIYSHKFRTYLFLGYIVLFILIHILPYSVHYLVSYRSGQRICDICYHHSCHNNMGLLPEEEGKTTGRRETKGSRVQEEETGQHEGRDSYHGSHHRK